MSVFGLLLGVILGSFSGHFRVLFSGHFGGHFGGHLVVTFVRKHQYYVGKTSISINHPFSFNHRFDTKKAPQKVIPGVILAVILGLFLIENINIT